ncbi:hypothetical protein ACGYWN_25620, partial [Burkholderia pseudomallei]
APFTNPKPPIMLDERHRGTPLARRRARGFSFVAARRTDTVRHRPKSSGIALKIPPQFKIQLRSYKNVLYIAK